MGSNAVKTIVILMVLVVFSMIIGAQITDSLSDSIGAFVVIGAVAAGFGMLYWGEKSWYLLYILPLMALNAPIGPGGSSVRAVYPIGFFLSAIVLIYGFIMWIMGYVKLRWRSTLVLDLLVLLGAIYMVAMYIRFPVSIHALGIETKYVGGKEYVWFIAAVVHYIAVSCMTGRAEQIPPLMKRSLMLFFVAQVAYIGYNLLSYHSQVEADNTSLSEERMAYLAIPAYTLAYLAYTAVPLSRLIVSWRHLLSFVLSFFMLLFVGGREIFGRTLAALTYAALLKREMTGIVLAVLLVSGGVFLLDTQRVWEGAPLPVQRVVSLYSTVHLDSSIRQGTEGSTGTRKKIWALGLDPRTGLIKDYICGDGFQTESSYLLRQSVAGARKTNLGTKGDDAWALELAMANNWHNGWLSTVKHLGLVGLVWVNLLFLCGGCMLFKVAIAYAKAPEYPYIMAICLPYVGFGMTFVIGTQKLSDFFAHFLALSFIKILYCAAREQGKLKPFFARPPYEPLMIQEMNAASPRHAL